MLKCFRSELEKHSFSGSSGGSETKKGKQARVWGLAGSIVTDIKSLDYSKEKGDSASEVTEQEEDRKFVEEQVIFLHLDKAALVFLFTS